MPTGRLHSPQARLPPGFRVRNKTNTIELIRQRCNSCRPPLVGRCTSWCQGRIQDLPNIARMAYAPSTSFRCCWFCFRRCHRSFKPLLPITMIMGFMAIASMISQADAWYCTARVKFGRSWGWCVVLTTQERLLIKEKGKGWFFRVALLALTVLPRKREQSKLPRLI